MSCPYFYPVEAVEGRLPAPADALMPLGDFWDGVCQAVSGHPHRPDDPALLRFCNLGYARGNCAHFPAGDGPDAVRFAIARDLGDTIRIQYAVETEHHPFAHGRLEYSRVRGEYVEWPADALLRSKALAYVWSYLRRSEDRRAGSR